VVIAKIIGSCHAEIVAANFPISGTRHAAQNV